MAEQRPPADKPDNPENPDEPDKLDKPDKPVDPRIKTTILAYGPRCPPEFRREKISIVDFERLNWMKTVKHDHLAHVVDNVTGTKCGIKFIIRRHLDDQKKDKVAREIRNFSKPDSKVDMYVAWKDKLVVYIAFKYEPKEDDEDQYFTC